MVFIDDIGDLSNEIFILMVRILDKKNCVRTLLNSNGFGRYVMERY